MKRMGVRLATFGIFLAAALWAFGVQDARAAGCAATNCCQCDDGCHGTTAANCDGVGEGCSFHANSRCLSSGLCSLITSTGFLSLNAAGTSAGVVIAWEKTADASVGVFNVLRSANADGPFARINAAPIAGADGQTAFSYTDADAAAGTSYYMVEEIGADGSATLHGVISADN